MSFAETVKVVAIGVLCVIDRREEIIVAVEDIVVAFELVRVEGGQDGLHQAVADVAGLSVRRGASVAVIVVKDPAGVGVINQLDDVLVAAGFRVDLTENLVDSVVGRFKSVGFQSPDNPGPPAFDVAGLYVRLVIAGCRGILAFRFLLGCFFRRRLISCCLFRRRFIGCRFVSRRLFGIGLALGRTCRAA